MRFYETQNLSFLAKNNETQDLTNTKFLNQTLTDKIDLEYPNKHDITRDSKQKFKKFFDLLDKQHNNPTVKNNQPQRAARDWDILKMTGKSTQQFYPQIDTTSTVGAKRINEIITPQVRNRGTLNNDALQSMVSQFEKKAGTLSVMGHQKDVKENAYSQVSVQLKYRSPAPSQPKSGLIQKTAKNTTQIIKDSERQLNLMNLEKLESTGKKQSQMADVVSKINRSIPVKSTRSVKLSNRDDEDNLSKRWQNLEKYADKQKSKKKKQFCKEYGSVFKETAQT